MKFCKANHSDLRKYFEKSYIKFPAISGDEAVYVDTVTSSYMSGTQLPDAEGATEWQFTYGDSNTDIEFLLPLKSFFEYDGATYLLHRIPARQYRRGICVDNTNILVLGTDGLVQVSLVLPLINAYTQKPAFTGFRSGYGASYPVSRRIAVDARGRIFVDFTCIGHYDDKKQEIKVSYDMFVPEIQAVLDASCQTITIVVASVKHTRPRKPIVKEPSNENT